LIGPDASATALPPLFAAGTTLVFLLWIRPLLQFSQVE
jgi:hypothetical protein